MMKKLLSIIFLSLIILSVTGCTKKDTSDVSVEKAKNEESNVLINNGDNEKVNSKKEYQNKKKEQTNGQKINKEECMKVARYGMDLSIAESKKNKKLADKIRLELEELEKKYGLQGSEFEKKCGQYMMDKDFLEMIQKKGYQLQQRE